MKISINHLKRFIKQDLDINDISKKLFQLGHENNVIDDLIDIEVTPNRGDCLSLIGIARDLNALCKTNIDISVYEDQFETFQMDFKNNAKSKCPSIYFLELSVKDLPDNYIIEVDSYFKDLNIKKNNFFTDISNYIAYELGQPTHCYDSNKINGSISLCEENLSTKFITLLDQEISLNDKNLVFKDDEGVINLAGIMGGKNTACNNQTKSVIIESAYFDPKSVIGKSIKYNINSDAAHKFERGVDPLMQEKAIRRFVYIVSKHCEIESLKLYREINNNFNQIELDVDVSKINRILGTNIEKEEYLDILDKLNFVTDKLIKVPSFRSDIQHQNDLAEEVARVIGYDQIKPVKFEAKLNKSNEDKNENKLKQFLKNKGFYEVINMPFVKNSKDSSLIIDNPLDSNRNSFRSELTGSLLSNLEFNERRQQDSIKIYEISDVYSNKDDLSYEKRLTIIVSGRQGFNFMEFSKKLDKNYLVDIFEELEFDSSKYIFSVDRNKIDSKSKNQIFVFDMNFDEFINEINLENIELDNEIKFHKYKDISDFPSTTRDISFSIKNIKDLNEIENRILNYKNEYLKNSFIFDFYNNEDKKVIKIGFRFIFQSNEKTLKDHEVDEQINNIIKLVEDINGVSVPGLV